MRLYGRDEALRSVATALGEPGSLVTITGLPGSGRTSVARAAVEVAGPEHHRVEGRRTTLPGALRAALEVVPPAGLVLVDDADHVTGAREVVRHLRDAQPGRRVLLVSRTPSGLADEVVVRLAPLEAPDPTEDPDVLRHHPAVQIFLDVASRTGTAAEMEDAAIGHVARICGALGGLPGAISLVAARTATYSPATLVSLLAREPGRLLRARAVAGQDDTHDLFAAVALSISLVEPGERALLEDLAVFHGPVGIEALAEVCGRAEVVDELSALVDVHLVEPHHDQRGSRFSLPPLLRGHLGGTADGTADGTAYSPSSPQLLGRHRRWARRVAEEAVALERAGRPTAARELVAPLEEDLEAALGRALRHRDASDASVLLLALLPVRAGRGTTPEVLGLTGTVLDLCAGTEGAGMSDPSDVLVLTAWRELLRAESAESPAATTAAADALAEVRERARSLGERALLEITCLAVQAARSMVERTRLEEWAHEGRRLAERLGDEVRLSRLETWCGMFAHQRGDFVAAARWARQALERSHHLDDPALVLRPSILLRGLPTEHGRPHDLPSLDQLVRLAHDCGDLAVLDWLEPTAAFGALTADDPARAAEHCATTLRRVRTHGTRQRSGPPLLCLFLLAVRTGDLQWAWRLRGILLHHDALLRPSLPLLVADAYDRAVRGLDTAAATHPEASTHLAWGGRLDLDEAIDAALDYAAQVRRTSPAVPASRPLLGREREPARPGEVSASSRSGHELTGHELTGRELDVLARLVSGGTNRDISVDLGISAKTVMHHTSAIYRKLRVRGRAEAVAWYLRHFSDDTGWEVSEGLHLVRGKAEA
ncbi:LuxR C-terminal-related transcriptional regulator [Ornithinimicrobium avium]|uniref:LuxR C-terminal-related transcriptional regulator n=1 Tax=Ornithinimicrobium avium TaxID=2283195 RepID=UPI0013B476C1|nr:LuxR C-terminal-related transcriptional regulator [Ornithinimicrobium avium]